MFVQMCPRDGLIDCSLVDALDRDGSAGPATVFQSWVWSYTAKMMVGIWENLYARQGNPDNERQSEQGEEGEPLLTTRSQTFIWIWYVIGILCGLR